MGMLGRIRRGRETGEWNFERDSTVRELLSDGNDGIISSAALIQGLLTAGATHDETLVGALAVLTIGALTAFATQFNESYAERQQILTIYESEQRRLKTSPEEEFAELVEIYEEKGLTRDLSEQVAHQLMEHDAIGAQMDAEFDIDDVPGRFDPAKRAAFSALAFLGGSVAPLLLLLLVPRDYRGEFTTVVVVISLALSGYIAHFSDYTKWWAAMLRTVLLGLAVLGLSTLAGSLVTF